MSSPPEPLINSLPAGFWWTAVLAFCVACVAPVLAWFAGRGQAAAGLQESLNSAFQTLAKELRAERSVHIARIAELEGEERQLHQRIDSLEALLRRSGVSIPKRPFRS